MMFLPLIFMGGFFASSLVILSAVAWLVWELCVMMYPERFWDHSNAALQCCECTDKLCTQYCQKLPLYKKCADYALERGIIIADTKFEFGLDENGNIVIGDEMLTPDSSRFWPADVYEPGHGQPSFDKQFARDWLKANDNHNWTLPKEVEDKTIAIYLEGYEKITGKKLV